jgi:hypothetical protein
MLLQDHQGHLHLFPALPAEWNNREISFKTLRSCGGVLVSAKANGANVKFLELQTSIQTEILIKNSFGVGQVCVEHADGRKESLSEKDGFFKVTLGKGRTKMYP